MGSQPAPAIAADMDLPTPAGAPAALDLSGPIQRATVDEWYLPTGDGCRLYVREFGSGDPVVVVHGGYGAEHSYLLDAVAGLEDRFHFIFYDQRGSLRSPCPDSLITAEIHVRDLERLRRSLNLDRVPIFAHSMGTFTAMDYLEEYPGRTAALALAGPILPRAPRSETEAASYRAEQQAFVAWAEARAEREREEEGLARPDSLLTPRQRTHKWRIGFAAGNVFRVDRWRLVKGGQVFYSATAGRAASGTQDAWDFTDELRRHPDPVTMILGDHDLVGFGGELHRQMLADVENVRLILLEDAGHNAWVDRPEAFRALLLEALAGPDG